MRTWLRILIGVVLAAAAALVQADPPGRVARLNYVAGPVSFAPADAPGEWVEAIVNRPLTSGDRLWVDRGARAEFHVGSTAVRVASLTSIDILHLDDDRMQFRVMEGAANVRVRDLDPEDVVEIATPAGAVLVRQPGSYRVTADPSTDSVRVAVNFGQAELVTRGRGYLVPTGQVAVVADGGAPYFEVATQSADEFDRWSAERDRREDRIASTRYVSPHMTGYEDLDRHGTWRTLPEYGAVWVPSHVAPGWAPYRHGHWAWISPWGWTWIDDAPWGFAPFHYGRWVWLHDHWAWAPGAIVRRPVYAPALVAFVGGSGWSVSVHGGPAVGWFPLGWREPYRPWYRASHTHVRNVNVTHVTNIYNTNVTHVHRQRPEAVTVVPQHAFVSARPAHRSRVDVRRSDLAAAPVIHERPPAEPSRASIAPERPGQRPPTRVRERDVASGRQVPPAVSESGESPGARRARENEAEQARMRGEVARPPQSEQRPFRTEAERRQRQLQSEGEREQRLERRREQAEQVRERIERRQQAAPAETPPTPPVVRERPARADPLPPRDAQQPRQSHAREAQPAPRQAPPAPAPQPPQAASPAPRAQPAPPPAAVAAPAPQRIPPPTREEGSARRRASGDG